MAFIFSTSHLPETRFRGPDHLEMLELGYGKDFDIRVPDAPMTLEFYQPKPGAPFTTRLIPASP